MKADIQTFQRVIQLASYRTFKQFNKDISLLVGRIVNLDEDTRVHSLKVAHYAENIAMELGLPMKMVAKANLAGILHDIGKIGIPKSTLLKKGTLTAREYERVKQHPVIGAKILAHIKEFDQINAIILHHHERYDGKGYPQGLKNDEIPLLSRVLAVADSFDAMTSSRCYRRALTFEQALDELKKNSGTQFEPDVLRAFMKAFL